MHCFEFFKYFTPKNIIENFHCDQILRITAKSKKNFFYEILYCTVYSVHMYGISILQGESLIRYQ